ncbi:lipopolysaccharide biosynthesis protein [Halobacterium yunchengense]|uniref:lipopolysaccharide biosynthesis protein n=1 Tax=Halobacterium yunchengense TaxID=3108497 RepID=UPI0030080466
MSRSVTAGFSFVVAAKVVLLVLGIVASPLLVAQLGTDPYGRYVFLFSLFSLYMNALSPGVTDGVRKYLGENRSSENWEGRILGFYLRYGLVLAVAGAAGLWLAARTNLLGRFLDGEHLGLYLKLLAVLVLATQFREYFRHSLMGFKLEHYAMALRVLYKVGFLALAIGLAVLGYSVVGVLASHIVMSVVVGAVGLAVVARRVSLATVLFPSSRDLPRREMLSFNSFSIVLILLMTSLYNVDILLLRGFAGETEVSYYKIALLFAEFLWFVPMALQTVLLQSTSELFERDDHARIKAIAARVTRYTTLLTALMGLGIAALASAAIPLMYSPEFVASVGPLLVLLPGAFGFAVARPILSIGQGSGRLRELVVGTSVAAALNVALNLALIPRYGTMGAAAATTTAYGSMLVFHVWSARRIGFDPLADIRAVRTATTVVFTAPVLYVLVDALPELVSLVVVPPVGLAVFTLAAFVTGALDPVEVTSFLSALPGPFGRFAEDARRLGGDWLSDLTFSRRDGQRWLLAAGAVFFAVGLVFSVAGAGLIPGLGGPSDAEPEQTGPPANATTVPLETTEQDATTGAATTDGTPTGGTTTDRPTTTSAPPGSETTTDQPPIGNETTTGQQPTTRQTTDQPTTRPTTTRTTSQPTTTDRATTQQTTSQPTTTQQTTSQQTTTQQTTTTTNDTTTSTTTETTILETTTNDTTTNDTTTTDDTTNDTTTQSTLLQWLLGGSS